MPLDLDSARKAGYSDTEIADELARQRGMDIKSAREAGYEDSEIIKFLTTGKGYKSVGMANAPVVGAYSRLADVLGTPVEAMTGAINQIRSQPSRYLRSPMYEEAPPPIQNPVGGRESFKKLFNLLPQYTLGGGFAPGDRTYGNIEELPPEERPLAAAGEVAGGSLPFMLAPFTMGGPLGQAARQAPGLFLSKEALATFGAAQGGFLSRLFFPESPTAQAVGEMAGGIVSPTSLVSKAGGRTASGLSKFVYSLTKPGREAAASDLLKKVLMDAGELDSDLIIAKLRAPTTLPVTAGMKAESPTLLALEKKLAKESPKFGEEISRRTEESIELLRKSADALSGDTASLRAASALRKAQFDRLIQSRIDAAQLEASKARTMLAGQENMQAASKRASQILDDALSEVRAIEKEKWALVDKAAQITPEGTLAAYQQLRTTLLKEEKVQPIVEDFIRRIAPKTIAQDPMAALTGVTGTAKEVKQISSGELLRFRSRMMDLARDAKGRGDFDVARQYNAMADGALADMEKIPGTAAEEARAYTRSLHDVFTRTFAGDVLAVKQTGAARIPEEATLERAFGTGGTMADVRLRNLQTASEFASPRFGAAMQSEQERFLSMAAGALRGPDGRVSPDRLTKFVAENEAVLTRFPQLRAELSNVARAERALNDAQLSARTASKAIQERAVFSQLLNYEDPSVYIGRALSSKTPERDFNQLVKLARKGNATNGLKNAVLDYASKSATDKAGNFSFSQYENILRNPIRKGGPSPLDIMERSGVMSRGDSVRLQKILAEARKIEGAMASRAMMEEIGDAPGALFDLVVRITGANIGGAGAIGQTAGAPIVAAGAGSRFARQLFEKVPMTRMRDVLIEASRNPEMMAKLLEKTANPRRQKQVADQIHAFLWQAGLTADEQR